MSANTRALLIGMLGPALQAVGVAWDLLEHAVLAPDKLGDLTLRHILMAPDHLVIFVGFILSVVCIPLAIKVAQAEAKELQMPVSDPINKEARAVIQIWAGEVTE